MPIENVRSSGGIAPASTIACLRVSHLRRHDESDETSVHSPVALL
jgi:hypothetical protein